MDKGKKRKSEVDGGTCKKSKRTIDLKVFNDPIHGHIELHPLLVKIIDTPEFQRLRNIKQLGGGYFVYPGASHNRFEHSIGVAYLAGKLAEALKLKQPELNIDDRDVICVQIAGLCHDLGHGPFSHLFDGMFNREADPEHNNWKHEDASLEMFDHLVKKNHLEEKMKEFKLSLPTDLIFIKEMIQPKKSDGTEWPYKGRGKEKSFLYEIVSNKENGIDVDKFDYFARDCHHLGIRNNFDHLRFIVFARVCDVGGWKHICSREKEVANLYDMFHTRISLHRRAYQHRVTKSVEVMIKDALIKADPDFQIEVSGETFRISQAKNKMEAYTKLTDQVLEEIYKSTSDSLKDAKDIIENIMTRKLYRCVGQAKPKMDQKKILEEMMKSLKEKVAEGLDQEVNEIIERLKTELEKAIPKDGNQDENHTFQVTFKKKEQEKIPAGMKESLKMELEQRIPGMQFEVMVVTMDYGMKDKDPINKTYFYRKKKPVEGFTIPKSKVSNLLPECFSEEILRVYLKNRDSETIKKAEKCFKEWCDANDFEVEKDDDDDDTSGAVAGTSQ